MRGFKNVQSFKRWRCINMVLYKRREPAPTQFRRDCALAYEIGLDGRFRYKLF